MYLEVGMYVIFTGSCLFACLYKFRGTKQTRNRHFVDRHLIKCQVSLSCRKKTPNIVFQMCFRLQSKIIIFILCSCSFVHSLFLFLFLSLWLVYVCMYVYFFFFFSTLSLISFLLCVHHVLSSVSFIFFFN